MLLCLVVLYAPKTTKHGHKIKGLHRLYFLLYAPTLKKWGAYWFRLVCPCVRSFETSSRNFMYGFPMEKSRQVLLAHLSRRLTGELIVHVYTGIRRPSVVRQHFQTTSPLKPSGGFFPYYTYSHLWVGGTKSYVFYSGRIRTLVAMATYSSHRLIMGKVEICIFFLSQ